MSADPALTGAWGGDPARKQASITAAREALAARPAVMCYPDLWLGAAGQPNDPSNVFCAAFGTADPAEIEAHAGLAVGTLMLASAALSACEYSGTTAEDNVSATRMAAGTDGAPIEALEAVRVGADPLALARCYVVDLLGRLATLVDSDGQVLAPEQQALVRQLATLHESGCNDAAAFRTSRRAATSATDAASGDVASAVLGFVESVAWPLAGLTGELPMLVANFHAFLRFHLRPERPTAEEQAALDALNKLTSAAHERYQASVDVDLRAELAKVATAPEYAAVNNLAFQARLAHYERVAAEAYAPFAVERLIGAFRRA